MATESFKSITFHEDASASGVGTSLDVERATLLTVEIFGTATSSNVKFEAQVNSNNWAPVAGINLATLTNNTETSGKSEIWQISLAGLTKIRMNLTAVDGGSITVTGRTTS